jgi:nicotinamidase/pyrazinamidase
MRALLLVDLQNDFLSGGALPVPRGDEVLAPANEVQRKFALVLATQDWHPADHGSFAANHPARCPGESIELDGLPQVLWPVHCVQHTHGAKFAAGLDTSHISHVFRKGTDPRVDSYSGFFDNAQKRSTGLGEYLREAGVDELYVLGLATDYCVRATALDAVRLGLRTWLVEDACRGVELRPGDVARAIDEMRAAGVTIVRSGDVPGEL